MARSGPSVLKSASTGILKPMHVAMGEKKGRRNDEDEDPVMAVLARNWTKKTQIVEDDGAEDKRHGKRNQRRGLAIADGKDADHDPLAASAYNRRNVPGAKDAANATGALRFRLGKDGLAINTNKDEDAEEEKEQPDSPLGRGRPTEGAGKACRRRYSTNLQETQGETSPKWEKVHHRRGTCKLGFKEADDCNGHEDFHHHHDDALTNAVNEADKNPAMDDHGFTELSHKFEVLISQTCMRMNNFLAKIREQAHEDTLLFDQSANFEHLLDISFSVSTVNYHVSKWLHQLEPRKFQAPPRPTKLADCTSLDLLAEIQYSLSRMEVLSSSLSPLLHKIAWEAKNLRRDADGRPVTPTSRNPANLAKKRGIVDVEEMGGIEGHLEHLLELAEFLAHHPVHAKNTVTGAVRVMQAAGKFKAGMVGGMGKTLSLASAAGDLSAKK